MTFVQYFELRGSEYVEPCGDRCVVKLDGRNNLNTMKEDALKFNGFRRPVYSAFQIRKGTFSNYKNLTLIIKI